jgi:hypothetical protein
LINDTYSDVAKHLWNRAHIKVMKLAALVAIGIDHLHPVVKVEHVHWAYSITKFDIAKLQLRFEKGEVGRNSEESKQTAHVLRVIAAYIKGDPQASLKLGGRLDFHRDKIIPYKYVLTRLNTYAAFKHDSIGATNAIKRTIQNLIDSGAIKEVGRKELNDKYDTSQRAFVIADPQILS